MTEKQIIDYLLTVESKISDRIHGAVSGILRSGYESERGKKQIPDMIESIQYILEDIDRIVNR